MNAHPYTSFRRTGPQSRTLTAFAAFLVTLLSANAHAVDFPNIPLETGTPYPPPNVRFILDDSGSMNLIAMPEAYDDPTDGSGNGASRTIDYSRISDASYVNNTIYYNPKVNYEPWMTAAGTRLADAAFNAASRHTALLTNPQDLRNDTQTFFIPKLSTTTGTDAVNYYRFQIIETDAPTAAVRGRIVRSEWLNAGSSPSGFPVSNLTDTNGSAAMRNVQSFVVPSGVTELTITLSGGTHGSNANSYNNNNGDGADLYVRRGSAPTTAVRDCRSTDNGNAEECVIANPTAGTWFAGIYRASRYIGVTMNVSFADPNTGVAGAGCATTTSGLAWRDCRFMTPDSDDDASTANRNEDAEKANYANWYAYHRSRMKVAKAGASEAFARIGSNLRIGLDTINRYNGGMPLDIPVGTDDGLFRGDNKSDWYAALHARSGDGSTLLHRALQRAGNYYSDDDSVSSPYRTSSTTDIISCRQNFAILTTDGYWNSKSGFTSVGDADGTAGPTIVNPKGGSRPYIVENPYRDDPALDASHRSNTLADVAMHYWKNDLVDDLPNDVPNSTDDPAFWQHMVTFGVSIGLRGVLNPALDEDALKQGTVRWPDARPDNDGLIGPARIDDLWHASVNSRGSFVVASNTEQFTRGLVDAFTLVASRQGSASNVTANSSALTTNSRVYQASYNTGRWSGDLKAFPVSESGVDRDSPIWAAATGIPATRSIFTWDPLENDGDGGGVTFPTAAQTLALDQSSRGLSPVSGADNVAYIKGDRGQESGTTGNSLQLRTRDSALGDIVNSSPAYVADNETVFFGANDGMLHAVSDETGAEVFAYVPGGINLADLATLSYPLYQHRYFVDGPVVVTSRAQTPNKNYLVGSLGRGGRGLFGLDVTNPASFDASSVLWELADPDLGNVLAEPLIATLNDDRKVAIVANGLNSDNGRAVLLVIDVQTGEILHRLDTGVGGDNGLFDARGRDRDLNGIVDFVYAGDRLGNLWKFDFTGDEPEISYGGQPMFETPSGQPITSGLALAKDGATGKTWVFFGTGSYMTAYDPTDTTLQSVYGLIDRDDSTPLDIDDLSERQIRATGVVNGREARVFEQVSSLETGSLGWYLALDEPAAGERVVSRLQIFGNALLFVSRVPPPEDALCDGSGSGYVNLMNAFTGGASDINFITINDQDEDESVGQLTVDGEGEDPGSIAPQIGMPTLPTLVGNLLIVGGSEGKLAYFGLSGGASLPTRSNWVELLGD